MSITYLGYVCIDHKLNFTTCIDKYEQRILELSISYENFVIWYLEVCRESYILLSFIPILFADWSC